MIMKMRSSASAFQKEISRETDLIWVSLIKKENASNKY